MAKGSKKPIDTIDHVDQSVVMRAHGYVSASEISAKTGFSLTTIQRWVTDEEVISKKLGNTRYILLSSVIDNKVDRETAKMFGLLPSDEPAKKERRKTP